MNKGTPFELHLRPLWFGLAYTLLLVVAVLSLAPTTPNVGDSDKLGHFLAYAVLSIAFSIIIRQRLSLWWVLFGLIAFGILMEYLQGLTGYRYADPEDALANSIGVVFGLLFHFSPLRRVLLKVDAYLHCLRLR
ncbi:MAG: VanZ family protein [Candidatus Azotimanducaceae bacterium]